MYYWLGETEGTYCDGYAAGKTYISGSVSFIFKSLLGMERRRKLEK